MTCFPLASVVIPAHDEANVIGRLLRALLADARPGELEIVVVATGCTDLTAETARGFGPDVRVVETEVASKVHALNLGDRAATAFPRLYVDADVVLDTRAVRETAAVLASGRALAAAPRLRVDLSGASAAVRGFYAVWTRHPHFRRGLVGSGVYGLSERGRRRFAQFPDVTADDAFVHGLFTPAERMTVPTCHFTVRAPRTLKALVKIKTRSRRGNRELHGRFPALARPRGGGRAGLLASGALRPHLWPAVPASGAGPVATAVNARRTPARARAWERDETSRTLS